MRQRRQNTTVPQQFKGVGDMTFMVISVLTLAVSASLIADPVDNAPGAKATVSATQLRYTTAPSGNVSGALLTTQPIVKAVDVSNNVDTDYKGIITLTEASAGVLGGIKRQTAQSGVVSFTDIVYSAMLDHEAFVLTASDGSLPALNSAPLDSDVVATKLVFSTQPTPTTLAVNENTAFTTVPVVQAQDANNRLDTDFTETITLSENGAGTGVLTNNIISASAGIATFTGLSLTHDRIESLQLVANDLDATGTNLPSITSITLIIGEADAALALANVSYAIPVNAVNNRVVGVLTATGGTGNAGATTFTITAGNDADTFSITDQGSLSVKDNAALSVGNQSLTIEASDGTSTDAATITLFITDGTQLSSDKDSDGNGITDTLEQNFGTDDSDNDGIPDALETLLGNDVTPTTDTDGDGMPDVAEVLLGRDPTINDNSRSGAPTVTVTPASLALLAKGTVSAYSHSELGVTASASLIPIAYLKNGACQTALPYNFATVCNAVPVSGFVSGIQNVWWLATNSTGNWGQTEQQLTILPQVGFATDLVLAGTASTGSITTSLVLSGQLATASTLTIPFTVAGNAVNPTEHDLVAGHFTFQAGKTVSDPVTITLGNAPVQGSTIELALTTNDAAFATANSPIDTTTQFVTVGTKTSQTITLSQQTYAPRLSNLRGLQGSGTTQSQGVLFDKSRGNVTLSFAITDPDSGDYRYNWLKSNSTLRLGDNSDLINNTTANPELDVSSLTAGNYYVEVEVTDNTAPNESPVKLGVILRIVDSITLSATADSDGDGKSDADEGLGDNDGDGRPDYLDGYDEQANVVPSDNSEQQNYLVKANPGLRVIIGTTAVAAVTGDTKITQGDLAQHGNNGESVVNSVPANTTLAHVFDYEIENITVPVDASLGSNVSIILPLDVALTADSSFLKYDSNNGWRAFTEDANNTIVWANWLDDVIGNCPETSSATYSNDTTAKAGKTCLKVTLQDGGANDADGVVNGRIIDPLGVGAPSSAGTTSIAINNSGGGGSLGLLELLTGLLLLLGIKRYAKRRQTDAEITAKGAE